MLSKEDLESCDSMLAQGGICVLHDENDYDSYFEDTMRAGHYENRKESVDLMIRGSRAIIDDLLSLGVRFAKNPDGTLAYTREGAHSRPRICFHEDITGKEITTTLLSHVKKLTNVTIMEYTVMTDILVVNDHCCGMIAKTRDGETLHIHAQDTVMATGGIGGLYEHSTNFPILTGDACGAARSRIGAHGLCADPSDLSLQQKAGQKLSDLRVRQRRGRDSLESQGRAVRQRTASARCRDESDPRGDGKRGCRP